ncbi:MAG: hypothetical protein ACRCXN_13005 [Bacteroidales bacterium]
MKKPNSNQYKILAFIQHKGGVVKKAEIVEHIGARYYHNASHYVGLTLARMVESGSLCKVKTGVYAVPNNPEIRERARKIRDAKKPKTTQQALL